MSKAVGFTLGPCILLQTCARACDCSGWWGRRMRGEMSCPGTAPGLDVAGMWNSITPRGRLRSLSSANDSAMSTCKAMASRRTAPGQLVALSSAFGTTTGPKPTLSTSCAYYRSQKKSSGTPSTPSAVPGDTLEDSPEPHQQVGEGGGQTRIACGIGSDEDATRDTAAQALVS